MKHLFYFFLPFVILACSGETDPTEEFEKIEYEEVDPYEDYEYEYDENTSEIWVGPMGDYGPMVAMYLNYDEESVTGRYFYVQHQKWIDLEGYFSEGYIYLTEYSKGKITGEMELNFYSEYEVEGFWYKPGEYEDGFYFYLEYFSESEEDNSSYPIFESYSHDFEVEVYNGGDDYDYEEATNEIKIAHINEDLFAFEYNVVGRNYHTGELGGIAYYESEGYYMYSDEEGCYLHFYFDGDQLEIDEEDCQEYRGMNAYFTSTLTQD